MHHTRERQAFGKRLADHALMQNVLADLALESEAATLLAFRLAHAFDRAAGDEHERHIMRILTPIAKYWHCKRITPFMVEAMECFGGNGYVEEGPMAGEMLTYDIPILDLSSKPLNAYYEREAVTYPASYISLLYPSAMMGEIRVEGAPIEWVVPGNARASRFIAKLNIMLQHL